jgi:oligopeptide/dipeptide ABC transporter ATP-binding protein
MYAGEIVEEADVATLFREPKHPYTQGLIACVPNILMDQKELVTMPGSPPDLVEPPAGCRFAPRCPRVMPICTKETPALIEHAPGHSAACWLYGKSTQESSATTGEG